MLYTLTIALSAFLLFLVQPLLSKILLPGFGGGASVWITSLVFFQTMLLVGYGGTHLLIRLLGTRGHLAFTALLLVVSAAFLPIGINLTLASELSPSPRLLLMLFAAIGVPYLLLASTSPTLQHWIANDRRAPNRNPYVEYGFSNLGSLLGLLAYPFVLELWLTTTKQTWLWTGLYVLYGALLTATIVTFLRFNGSNVSVQLPAASNGRSRIHWRWLMLALIPSALLLTTTHYVTVDVVNLPLLWIAPLCLYLMTFVLCFLRPSLSAPSVYRTMAGVLAILLVIVAARGFIEFGFGARITFALVCLFVIGMICHGDLERAKPEKQDLTNFYLHLSAGGAAGSLLVGLLAPVLFDSLFEFEIVLVAALYYVVISSVSISSFTINLLRAGAIVSLVAAWVINEVNVGNTVFRERSFFGAYAVREIAEPVPSRRLVAGTHVHGEQLLAPQFEHLPVAYYHESTGVAHAIMSLQPSRFALVGLGVGSIVEYASAGDHVDIYEIDPVVVDIALSEFTVLTDSPATIRTIVGDGRVQLRDSGRRYDIIVLDAFTSGSIPTHLLTVDAAREMLARLEDDGILAYHISNQHVDLLPVVGGIARALNLSIAVHQSSGTERLRMYPSTWVVLSPASDTMSRIVETTPGWHTEIIDTVIWTDEYSNIWSVLSW